MDMADREKSRRAQAAGKEGRVIPAAEIIMRRIEKRYSAADADPARLVDFVSAKLSADDGMAKVLQQLREAIEASPMTRYALSRRTGIPQSQLSRLMSGEAGLSLDSLEKLCDELGIEITLRKKRAAAR